MNFIRYSLLLFLISYAVKAYPAERTFSCKPVKTLMKEQLSAGYGYLATSIAKPGVVIQLYLNLNTGAWRMIGVDEDLNGCLLLDGTDWQFALVRGA